MVSWMLNIDRRIIYLLVLVALGTPLYVDYSIAPAPMKTADAYYAEIEKIQPRDKIVLIAADWGPGTQAENEPQTAVTIEHLMRRRIPFALISNIPFAKPFLEQLPVAIADRLEGETGEQWDYGQDWVNLGYRPGGSIMIQGMAKASDLHEVLKTDSEGTAIAEIPLMRNVRTIRDIALLVEITGYVGTFNSWVQFFRHDSYVPAMLHGCTAITIPEAYIYYVSKQIVGLFEGVAGAAWYEELLSRSYPKRDKGSALQMMTALSFAHLLIIALIVVGNLGTVIYLFNTKWRRA